MKKKFYLFLTLGILTIGIDKLNAQSYSGGSGTLIDPFLISNKMDLKYLSENSGEWNKHFKHTADITFNSTDFETGGDFYNMGAGFIPIGNSTTNFTGSYNGTGHIIKGLFINKPTVDNIGLFGKTSGACIIDSLGVINIDINGKNNVGGLVGYSNGLVNNCLATGSVKGNFTSSVGGLVGENWSDISNSYASVNVNGPYSLGGLVGRNLNTINNCYATGDVSGGSFAGGLVGLNAGEINISYAVGNINVTAEAGGLVGYNSGFIYDSYAKGNVTSIEFAGGLVGINNGLIENCYSTGIPNSDYFFGGLVGDNSGVVNTSFWDINTSGQNLSEGGTGRSTGAMKTQSTYTNVGWDFTDIWFMELCTNQNYPSFNGMNNPTSTPAPTGNISQIVCNSGTINELMVSGISIQWYDAQSGGNLLDIGTSLIHGNSYFASQTLNTCESIDRLDVTVTINTTPTNMPTGLSIQELCDGSTLEDIEVSGVEIKWYNVSSGGSEMIYFTPLIDGSSYFASQTIDACESTDRLEVVVSIIDPINTVSQNGITLTADEIEATYQWLDCDNGNSPINGETFQSFTPTINGNYAVEVTKEGCTNTSSCNIISTVGLNDFKKETFKVYPNPNNGSFTIESGYIGSKYIITDMQGRQVSTGIIDSPLANINIENQSKGLYFLKVENTVEKILKQ